MTPCAPDCPWCRDGWIPVSGLLRRACHGTGKQMDFVSPVGTGAETPRLASLVAGIASGGWTAANAGVAR